MEAHHNPFSKCTQYKNVFGKNYYKNNLHEDRGAALNDGRPFFGRADPLNKKKGKAVCALPLSKYEEEKNYF